jgi:hypothetical protein
MTPGTAFQLRSLPCGARVGLVCLCLVLLGGLVASGVHLKLHHQNRDERPGLTLDDLEGAYHGINTVAPLRAALERGHPQTLKPDQRDALLMWLRGTRISEDYDNPEMGDHAPAEIIQASCLSCHGRAAAATSPIARTFPLDNFENVKALAFSRKVNPTPANVLIASTHAHALALGSLSVAVAGLLWFTRWNRRIVSAAIGLAGVCLLADLAGWWLARDAAGLVWMIVAAGVGYSGVTGLSLLAVIADLLLPRRE